MRRGLLRWRRPLVVPTSVSLPAQQTKPPKLRIYRGLPGWWYWDLDRGDGTGCGASAPTWGQALVVGLAALEAATVRGIDLPPGWEKITP